METEYVLLVADSNPYVRSFLKRELTESGYQVKIAGSAKEIFASLKSAAPPDILILDLNMPLKIGLQVLSQLHKLVPRPQVIVYSDLVEYRHHETVQWVNAFVEKNGSPIPLKNAIEKVLQTRHAHRMAKSKNLEISK